MRIRQWAGGVACVASALLCTSCATVFSGTTADIHIDGDVGEPVTVVTSKGEYRDVTLPTTVKIRRRSLDGQHIRISSESYAFSDIVLKKSVNPWSIVDALPYGIPLMVDLATNAASKPAQSRFFVTPGAPRAQADSLHRADSLRVLQEAEARRLSLEQKRQQAESHFNRHELRFGVGFGRCQAEHDRDKLIGSFKDRYGLTDEEECGNIFGNEFLQAGGEYHYRLSRKWEIGALVDWGFSSEGYVPESWYDATAYSVQSPDDMVRASESSRFFVVAPSVRYTWYEIANVRAYSRVALGAMRHHLRTQYGPEVEDRIQWRMAYQLTAAGVTFGFPPFFLFGEVGFGCLGNARFGVCLTF